MVAAEHQLTEKLVFFWHGHWATSVQKVKSARADAGPAETLRRHGRGAVRRRWSTAMVRDPALIIWLDGQKNTRKAPNENLARELMELFTLGIGHYTEDDVKAGARALTGWTVDRRTGIARFEPKRHDPGDEDDPRPDRRRSTPTASPGCWPPSPRARAFVAGRLWFRYAGTDVPGTGPAWPAPDTDARRCARSSPRRPSRRPAGTLVKQPVEWLVGALRQLGVRPSALPEQLRKQLLGGLNALGQVPLRPPSVGGWPAGAAWLTTSSLQARLRLAELLAAATAPAVLARLTAAPAAGPAGRAGPAAGGRRAGPTAPGPPSHRWPASPGSCWPSAWSAPSTRSAERRRRHGHR